MPNTEWQLREQKIEHKGTYRHICWSMTAEVVDGKQTFKWAAGFRGHGTAQSLDECKENIKNTIDKSLEREGV